MRFWIKFSVYIASGALTALSAVWPDWIERVVGFGPDGGNGSTEWALVSTFTAFSVVFIALSARTWQHRSPPAEYQKA
jgi:hypothetical protein